MDHNESVRTSPWHVTSFTPFTHHFLFLPAFLSFVPSFFHSSRDNFLDLKTEIEGRANPFSQKPPIFVCLDSLVSIFHFHSPILPLFLFSSSCFHSVHVSLPFFNRFFSLIVSFISSLSFSSVYHTFKYSSSSILPFFFFSSLLFSSFNPFPYLFPFFYLCILLYLFLSFFSSSFYHTFRYSLFPLLLFSFSSLSSSLTPIPYHFFFFSICLSSVTSFSSSFPSL